MPKNSEGKETLLSKQTRMLTQHPTSQEYEEGRDALEKALDADDSESLQERQQIVKTAVGASGDPEELLKRIRARFDRHAPVPALLFRCLA